jgi:chromosome segregation ATPase
VYRERLKKAKIISQKVNQQSHDIRKLKRKLLKMKNDREELLRNQVIIQERDEFREQISPIHNAVMQENAELKDKLESVKGECEKMKGIESALTQKMNEMMVKGAHLEDSLEDAERVITQLRDERNQLKTKLGQAESFLNQITERVRQGERDSMMLKEHMMKVNAGQGEMVELQMENNRLKERLDIMERDLESYTERQRRLRIRMPRKRVIGRRR